MTEIGPAVTPPPEIWPAIERRLNLLNARQNAAAARPVPSAAPVTRPKPDLFENRSFWRGWSITAIAIAAIALVVSIRELSTVAPVPAPVPAPQVAQEPRIGYVVTLADDKSNTRMLVTWDDRTPEVTVRCLIGSSDPSDKSMQL